MTYHRPPLHKALTLMESILRLMEISGGHYAEGTPDWLKEHVIIAIATGQFYFSDGDYFVCWWMVKEEDLQGIKEHIRPPNLTDGDVMYIPECCCISGMNDIRRKLRRHAINGVHWHRSRKGWRHFPRQGGTHGKQQN